jgi:hypothetical protein
MSLGVGASTGDGAANALSNSVGLTEADSRAVISSAQLYLSSMQSINDDIERQLLARFPSPERSPRDGRPVARIPRGYRTLKDAAASTGLIELTNVRRRDTFVVFLGALQAAIGPQATARLVGHIARDVKPNVVHLDASVGPDVLASAPKVIK